MKNELQEKNSKEESIKIILIGEVYTGKTSLINVYIKKEYIKKQNQQYHHHISTKQYALKIKHI